VCVGVCVCVLCVLCVLCVSCGYCSTQHILSCVTQTHTVRCTLCLWKWSPLASGRHSWWYWADHVCFRAAGWCVRVCVFGWGLSQAAWWSLRHAGGGSGARSATDELFGVQLEGLEGVGITSVVDVGAMTQRSLDSGAGSGDGGRLRTYGVRRRRVDSTMQQHAHHRHRGGAGAAASWGWEGFRHRPMSPRFPGFAAQADRGTSMDPGSTLSYEQLLALDDTITSSAGLTPSDIDHNTVVVQVSAEDVARWAQSGGGACALCLEEYAAGDTIRRLPCLHFFHADCVDRHFENKKDCPLCRKNVV
jgi:hypothetical protein